MDELNSLLIEIELLNKRIFEVDIFIRFHLKLLQDKYPKVWSRFLDLKNKYLNLNHLNEDPPLENPLVKNKEKENNALEKLKKKKCKDLYKKISNITHPDKTINDYLNQLFIIAKDYKNTSNLRGLENIYDVVQKQLSEPSYDFFAIKLVELKEQLKIINKVYNDQLMSFEYRVAVLYESPEEASKREAENLFVSKLSELMKFYSQEISKYDS